MLISSKVNVAALSRGEHALEKAITVHWAHDEMYALPAKKLSATSSRRVISTLFGHSLSFCAISTINVNGLCTWARAFLVFTISILRLT
jgi:hypothetical protein